MVSGFEKRIADFAGDNELFGSGGRILLAVSGGADSTALLYAMCALEAEGVVESEWICAHINHQLRGSASDGDEEFVVEQAGELGLEVRIKRVEVRGYARRNRLSIETAARQVRIDSLLEIARQCRCALVATGHQKDDNAETVVQRLGRGTGIRGLGGIWPMRVFGEGEVRFVRPMLCARRAEIIAYLKQRGLRWRRDRTNADCTYRRNYIRHRLLPVLQADCAGPLVEQLFDLSRSARGYYDLVCRRADRVWVTLADFNGEKVVLDCDKLLAEAKAVRVELVRRGLGAVGSGQRDIAQGHYERILELAERKTGGRRVELPGGFVVRREYGNVIFERATSAEEQAQEGYAKIAIPGQTLFGGYVIEARILHSEKDTTDSGFGRNGIGAERFVERFDLDKVELPVVVRARRDGDRFVPLGLKAEKKVGKFLSDARVPSDVRRKILVVADREKVIWVWPIRMSDQAKVTGRTRKTLQIEIACASSLGDGKEVVG
ncbi:MAG: tRNA lysidine(34) synthetase TilS [Phycisphaerae bacterium]|nr:tRNA lysidine(34) synthetase TilS [Phycisphaerae bacterium]